MRSFKLNNFTPEFLFRYKALVQWGVIVFLLLFSLRAYGQEVKIINPEILPKILYVAIHYSDPSYRELPYKRKKYIDNLLKENLKVVLYSKGFKIAEIRKVRFTSVNYLIDKFAPSKGEGILLIDLNNVKFLYGIVAGQYTIEGSAVLINSNGEIIGRWSAIADKKEINIPFSITDIAKLFLKAITHNTDAIIYNLVQTWVHKLCMQIPDLPASEKSIKVYFTNWFIGDEKTGTIKYNLKRGDVIAVVLEGQPSLKGQLIISNINGGKTIIREIKHSPNSAQVYIGKYIIKEGDSGTDVEVSIKLTNPFGDELTLTYPQYLQIDGIPPLPPVNLTYEILTDGIKLYWDIIKYSPDFDHFEIYRKTIKDKDFKLIGKTREKTFFDKNISEGNVYIYKVVAVDHSGNISDPNKSPTVEVVIPLKKIVTIEKKPLYGELKPATYLIGSGVVVPRGKTLIAKYVKLVLMNPITVQGDMVAEKSQIIGNPSDFLFSEHNYKNSDCLIIDGGKAILQNVELRDCKIALFVKKGFLKGENIKFVDNEINIVSYEPKNVVLKNVDFGTTKITQFKIYGKVNLLSIYDPFQKREIPLTNQLLLKLQKDFNTYVGMYTRYGNYKKVLHLFKSYVPILNNPDLYSFYDQRLVSLCVRYKDYDCLKYFLPALIELYPNNTNYAIIYVKLLYKLEGKEKACQFLNEYLNTHSATPQLEEIKNTLLKCSSP
jgi:hypothetical protein